MGICYNQSHPAFFSIKPSHIILEYNRYIPRLYLCICYLWVVTFHLLHDSSPCFVILILILQNWFIILSLLHLQPFSSLIFILFLPFLHMPYFVGLYMKKFGKDIFENTSFFIISKYGKFLFSIKGIYCLSVLVHSLNHQQKIVKFTFWKEFYT